MLTVLNVTGLTVHNTQMEQIVFFRQKVSVKIALKEQYTLRPPERLG